MSRTRSLHHDGRFDRQHTQRTNLRPLWARTGGLCCPHQDNLTGCHPTHTPCLCWTRTWSGPTHTRCRLPPEPRNRQETAGELARQDGGFRLHTQDDMRDGDMAEKPRETDTNDTNKQTRTTQTNMRDNKTARSPGRPEPLSAWAQERGRCCRVHTQGECLVGRDRQTETGQKEEQDTVMGRVIDRGERCVTHSECRC